LIALEDATIVIAMFTNFLPHSSNHKPSNSIMHFNIKWFLYQKWQTYLLSQKKGILESFSTFGPHTNGLITIVLSIVITSFAHIAMKLIATNYVVFVAFNNMTCIVFPIPQLGLAN
jgi:hypothetical protein